MTVDDGGHGRVNQALSARPAGGSASQRLRQKRKKTECQQGNKKERMAISGPGNDG